MTNRVRDGMDGEDGGKEKCDRRRESEAKITMKSAKGKTSMERRRQVKEEKEEKG